jgi:hypothetical protein
MDGSDAPVTSELGAGEPALTLLPDGRLLAFVSEESGQPEVYVVAVGEPGQKARVSAAGGSLPVDPRPGAVIAVVLGWRAAIGGSESERDN